MPCSHDPRTALRIVSRETEGRAGELVIIWEWKKEEDFRV